MKSPESLSPDSLTDGPAVAMSDGEPASPPNIWSADGELRSLLISKTKWALLARAAQCKYLGIPIAEEEADSGESFVGTSEGANSPQSLTRKGTRARCVLTRTMPRLGPLLLCPPPWNDFWPLSPRSLPSKTLTLLISWCRTTVSGSLMAFVLFVA